MRKPLLFLALALAVSMLTLPKPSSAQVAVGISVRVGPPALPVYAQPVCPGPDYIWTPGFWAWGPDGYYWVPGTWVLAPEPGLLWTPGYWGFAGGLYAWHPGYWGRHVGFYGGIDYGFGYFGVGFAGGEWRGNHFAYNRAVTNVNINVVHNVYVNRNYRREDVNHISYNGGPHGIDARPNREQMQYDRERHFERTSEQERHDMQARDNRAFRYNDNHGRPPVGASQRPGEFRGNEGARPPRNEFHPPNNGGNRPAPNDRNFDRSTPSHETGHNFGAPPRENPGRQPQRSEAAPHGNPHPQAQPHPKEQPRGHEGDHGKGDHGHDNEHH
jgi:WXXGXW repeat (2 copies)